MELPMPKVTKVCEWCGGEFEVVPSHAERRRYCSVACAGRGRRRECSDERRCPTCGKVFRASRWSSQTYCSPRCVNIAKTKKVTKRCSCCGAEFTVHWKRRKESRYCSIECLARAKRKVSRRPTRAQLAALLVHHTLVAIGQMYDVTPNAVRFWAKQYGLKWPNKKERNRLQRLKPRERDKLVDELLTNGAWAIR